MSEEDWVSCAPGFIEADVVRWREGIWVDKGPKGPARGQRISIGTRLYIAQVILKEPDEDGWCWLVVEECVTLDSKVRVPPPGEKRGVEIKRKISSILKGKPERKLWTEEEVRAGLFKQWWEVDRKPVSSARRYAEDS